VHLAEYSPRLDGLIFRNRRTRAIDRADPGSAHRPSIDPEEGANLRRKRVSANQAGARQAATCGHNNFLHPGLLIAAIPGLAIVANPPGRRESPASMPRPFALEW
jgi:hypothetical protein